MVLDDLIETLEKLAENGCDHLPVRTDTGKVPHGLCSWRGRYAELTLDCSEGGTTILATLLQDAREAKGRTFEGYKGGDFTMSGMTPVWADEYGSCAYNIPVKIEQVGNEVVIQTIQIGDYA